MTPNISAKERYLNVVTRLSGLPRSEFKKLSYAELRELMSHYKSIFNVKYKTRKKKIKSCWGVR